MNTPWIIELLVVLAIVYIAALLYCGTGGAPLSEPPPSQIIASAPRSVAIGGNNNGTIDTGDKRFYTKYLYISPTKSEYVETNNVKELKKTHSNWSNGNGFILEITWKGNMVEINLQQSEGFTVTFQDDDNPLNGYITVEFNEEFISIYGEVKGLDQNQEKVKIFCKRS